MSIRQLKIHIWEMEKYELCTEIGFMIIKILGGFYFQKLRIRLLKPKFPTKNTTKANKNFKTPSVRRF